MSTSTPETPQNVSTRKPRDFGESLWQFSEAVVVAIFWMLGFAAIVAPMQIQPVWVVVAFNYLVLAAIAVYFGRTQENDEPFTVQEGFWLWLDAVIVGGLLVILFDFVSQVVGLQPMWFFVWVRDLIFMAIAFWFGGHDGIVAFLRSRSSVPTADDA